MTKPKKYFDADFNGFFSALEKNNNRDWFQSNKKTYEKKVKEPFKVFITDLLEAYEKEYGDVSMRPKDCIFRLHRDIRFSNDKTPYKIHMAAMISKNGKKDHSLPGLYFQANHHDVRVYSGSHMLDKTQLHSLREQIKNNLKTFDQLTKNEAFVTTFGQILGEKNKRLPKEFQEAAERQPLIYNKNFYYFHKENPELIMTDQLIPVIMDTLSKAKDLNNFITEAIG